MNATAIIARLDAYPPALIALASIAARDDGHWKPSPKDWSILEICCHLLDEEREDFRVRLSSTLEDPARPWAPLVLDGVAEQRRYNEQELGPTLDLFAAERAGSVAWLRSLGEADWSRAYAHPKVGPITAGDLLASWAAHDSLHIRQIAKRLHGLAARDGSPNKIVYAGEWTA